MNGVNLGLAASNVPPNVYGVLDLYGQAAEASIIQPIEGNHWFYFLDYSQP